VIPCVWPVQINVLLARRKHRALAALADTHWQETQLLLSVWLVSHHVKLVLSLSTTVSVVLMDFISKVGNAYPRLTLDLF
jgi:hypothetical protein